MALSNISKNHLEKLLEDKCNDIEQYRNKETLILQSTTYTKLDLDYEFNTIDDPNRYYYRSDHYNFAKNNVPVIFYFNGVHADYHKPTDTVDKINFDKIETITRLVFYTSWQLANKEKRIKVDVEQGKE